MYNISADNGRRLHSISGATCLRTGEKQPLSLISYVCPPGALGMERSSSKTATLGLIYWTCLQKATNQSAASILALLRGHLRLWSHSGRIHQMTDPADGKNDRSILMGRIEQH